MAGVCREGRELRKQQHGQTWDIIITPSAEGAPGLTGRLHVNKNSYIFFSALQMIELEQVTHDKVSGNYTASQIKIKAIIQK